MIDLVSVIIPVYNVEAYLHVCLDSVCKQHYSNLQIIIVNDGSSDDSGAICKCYQRLDARIVLIEQENQGVSHARNVALEYACGDWIMFVDSDDYLAPSMVELVLAYAQENQVDMVQCEHCKVYNGHAFSFPHLHKPQSQLAIDAVVKLVHKKLFQNYLWGKLYRRSLFQSIRFPIDYHFEDAYTMILLMLEADRIGYIPTNAYYYRLRKGSITTNMNAQKIKEMKDAFLFQRNLLKRKKIPASNYKSLWMCDAMMLLRRLCYRESLPQAYVWGMLYTHKEGTQNVL